MANEDTVTTAVDKLKQACDKAYDDTTGKTSCSHAVWIVMKEIIDTGTTYRQANSLVDFLDGETEHWYPVTVSKAGELGNRGEVVIGGAKVSGGSGHVIIVYPGALMGAGGYMYNYKGKQTLMPRKGSYPRALSTSSGSWPGAKSKGDKTVWDPWANDTAFAKVKFWARRTGATTS